MDTVAADAVNVGGKTHTVLHNPNLSKAACEALSENVARSILTKVSSYNELLVDDSSDIYDMQAVKEALSNNILDIEDNDIMVLEAITADYIEIP